MSLGDNDLLDFYTNKSIVNSYNFTIDFVGNGGGIGFEFLMKKIKPFHILSVDIPTNKFQRESMSYGATQFSFPVLSQEQPLDVRIVFEEDGECNVGEMLNTMQQSVVSNGVHSNIEHMNLGSIYVTMHDQHYNKVCRWIYDSVFFLGYDPLNLAYTNNESLKYNATFGSDVMQFEHLFNPVTNIKSPIPQRFSNVDLIRQMKLGTVSNTVI